MKDKRSFFERLTGTISLDDQDDVFSPTADPKKKVPPKAPVPHTGHQAHGAHPANAWEDKEEEGELTVDVYQTATDIVVKAMIAGVKPEDLDVSISRDLITLRGHREEMREVSEDDYFHRELYWGTFSRTIMLPEEIDVDTAVASEKNGMLTIRLPKINKNKQTKLRVRSSSER